MVVRHRRFAPVIVGLLLAAGPQAHAQNPGAPLAAAPSFRFESWRPALPSDSSSTLSGGLLVAASSDRGDRALLGGVIGAAAGVVFCTVMSTLINDSAEGGLSFCPLDSYLLFAGGGFVIGAAIGWLTSD
jgi:hypothetical protein